MVDRGQEGTPWLRTGKHRAHFSKTVEGIDAGTTGGREGGTRGGAGAGGDERDELDKQGKGPRSSERNAQCSALNPPLGARGHDPPGRQRVAWRKHPNWGMSTAGGALTRVRSCQGRPGRVRTGAGRAWSTWEVTGRGSNWDGVAVSGSDDNGRGSKGHAWPLPQRDSRCKYANWGGGQQGALVVPKDETDPWHDCQGLGVKERGASLSWWWVEARGGAHARVWTLQVCRRVSEADVGALSC